MKSLRVLGAALVLMLGILPASHAQHTFSIVAIDPATGEVGSAGASCITVDATLISDVHPGIGAIHTQARYHPSNQDQGYILMNEGFSVRQILDSLIANDAENNPAIRQYGLVKLAGDQKSIAFTGDECMDYKGHITGPTYAIQGNILLGRAILDSMEARFLRQEGSLAERLMAALQGANVVGADTRCAPSGTSSHSSFLRVAKPGDSEDKLYLDLRANLGNSTVEPIDSLQTLFDRWKASMSGVRGKAKSESGMHLEIRPNPATPVSAVHYRLPHAAHVRVTLFNELGERAATLFDGRQPAGEHRIPFDSDGLAAGTYYCRLSAGSDVATQRVIVGATGK